MQRTINQGWLYTIVYDNNRNKYPEANIIWEVSRHHIFKEWHDADSEGFPYGMILIYKSAQ